MLQKFKSILKFGNIGKTDEQENDFNVVDGVVLGINEIHANNLKQEEVAELDEVLEKHEHADQIKNGRLPKIEKFWVYLLATGRAKRTIKTYKYVYEFWRKRSKKNIYFLQVGEIEELIKDMHPSTANKKVAFLRKLGKWFLREGKQRLHLELAKLEVPKQVKRLPADRGSEEFLKYRKIAKQWCKEKRREGIWLALMLIAGLRISEIYTVKIGHQNSIRVIGKGNKERIVPVPPWILSAMARIKTHGRGGWKMKRKTIWAVLNKCKIRHPHSFRHTYASELLRKHKRIEDVKILLGHENIATTNIYTNVAIPDDVVDLLEE